MPITCSRTGADDDSRKPLASDIPTFTWYRPAPAFPPDASGPALGVLVWMLEQPRFSFEGMATTFPDLPPADHRALLDAGLATGAFVAF